MSQPRQPQDKFVLRLPDGMRDEIAARAKENNRSMNAEIVARLQASLGEISSVQDPKAFAELIKTIFRQVREEIAEEKDR